MGTGDRQSAGTLNSCDSDFSEFGKLRAPTPGGLLLGLRGLLGSTLRGLAQVSGTAPRTKARLRRLVTVVVAT